MKKPRAIKWSTALVLLTGISATLLSAHWLEHANQRQIKDALQSVAEQTADAVVHRIHLYQYGLRGARGAILASGEHDITRLLFLRYSKTRDIDQEFPGARGFGFIRRVPRELQEEFLADARADGAPNFSIRHLAPHEGESFVIQYIEPMERNRAALGLDIASEKNRYEAALSAMQSGEARISAPITLVQASDRPQQSFLILMPIYRTIMTPTTQEERMRQGFGWSYAPLLGEEVIRGLGLDQQSLHLRLRDITVADNALLFYESPSPAGSPPEVLRLRVEREIYGRLWQIELDAYPAFVKHLRQVSPKLVYLIGGLLSLLLTALTEVAALNRQRLQDIFSEQARRSAIVESSNDSIISKTLEGVVTSWNKGAEKMFGYSAEEAIGKTLLQLIVPPQLAYEETEILRQLTAGETVQDLETLRRRKDGHILDVSASISPVRNEYGQVVGVSKTLRDISERKANEAKILELNATLENQVAERTRELRELNSLLSSVLDSASEVAIIATDTSGTIRIFNRGAQNMLGYFAEQVIDHYSPTLFHQEEEVTRHAEQLSQEYGMMISGFRALVHRPEHIGAEVRQWTYVRQDGSHIQVSLAVTAIRSERGHITGYLGIAIDISQQQEAERRLAESLATTRAVLETAINPVITFHADGRVQTFNPAAQQAFGCNAEAMGGRSLYELIGRQFHEQLRQLIARYVEGDNTQRGNTLELNGRHQDGDEFPIQMSISSMPSHEGAMLVGVITDLSQQVALRQELLAARDQLMMAADVAQLGIWSWTPADGNLQWNDRMYELYDQPKNLRELGLRYEHWESRVHPEDVEVTVAKLQAAVAGTDEYDPIFRIIRGDGEVRYIQAGAQIERNTDGKPVKVTGINLDITAQHEMETHLRYAKEQADAANAAKSAFLANMSHEIRTPMNAVLGMLQLVQATELTERQHDYLRKAHGAAKSLLGLLNDILDYSKIEAGKLQLDLHPFELEPMMRDLAVVLAGNQGQKDVEVMFDLDPNLPQTLIGDSLRLQQILINLSGNALKFTEHGQVVVSLRQLAQHDDRVRLRIAIRDTGIGISEQQLERIFEGFTQAEASTTRRFGGTGLGLVICKRLIRLMGGELQVSSRLGEGSQFWFDIELQRTTPSTLRASCAGADSRLRILIADDNEVAGELLTQLASDLGWQAEYVSNGQQVLLAVEAAEQQGQPFQVILLDWRMPIMDGISTALQLQESPLHAPPKIIMITAHGREVIGDIQQQGQAPFAAFLTKPVTPLQLATSVHHVLHGEPQSAPATTLAQLERLTGLNLLVVEDNPLNRQVAQELLEGEGASVQLAEDGQAGVTAVLEAKPQFDAVLMDIQMPVMDGLQATRLLRSRPDLASLPIIAMTANASQSDRETCLQAGMTDHVGKPIDLEQLIHTLQRCTGRQVELPSHQPINSESDMLTEPRDAVLKRFGGNLKLLRNVLGNFEPEMTKQLTQLAHCITQQDAVGVRAALHTLKGSSGTMGAKGLSDAAARLEQQFKQATHSECATLLNDPTWLAELNRLLAGSTQALHEAFAEPEGTTVPNAVHGDANWLASLQSLLTLLSSGNLQAIENAQVLSEEIPPPHAQAYAELLQAVELLDFEQAHQLGQALTLDVKRH